MGHLTIFTVLKRILNSEYNHGIKNLKSVTFGSKMHLQNMSRDKSKTGARLESSTHRLLA